jgi:hypothetical protein
MNVSLPGVAKVVPVVQYFKPGPCGRSWRENIEKLIWYYSNKTNRYWCDCVVGFIMEKEMLKL